jgi:hypothetical protein
MKSIKQLTKEHGRDLDGAFFVNHPEGRFTIQRIGKKEVDSVHLQWSPKRQRAGANTKGITLIWDRKSEEITERGHRVSPEGKFTYYSNLRKMVESAVNFGFPENLINKFIASYNKRDETFFNEASLFGFLSTIGKFEFKFDKDGRVKWHEGILLGHKKYYSQEELLKDHPAEFPLTQYEKGL